GVIPLAPSLDHVGVMGRSVRDLAILLQTIAGPDPCDPHCSGRPVPDLLGAVERTRPAPRLGRVRGLFEQLAETQVRVMMEKVSSVLRAQGATLIDVALPAGFAEVIPRHRAVMAVEGAIYTDPRLRRYPDDYQPKIRGLREEGLACPAAEYARCKEHQRQLSQDVLAS